MVGDLAFYAMVLGRESSSPHNCYLCRLSKIQFAKCLEAGELWTYAVMDELVRSKIKKGKPIEGCKEKTWWQCIPLNHLLVPLLHCLTGIGDDVYNNFLDIIKEVAVHHKVRGCEEAIELGFIRREIWSVSEKRKSRSSLKGKIYRKKVSI